jgi:SAM-dependent methyltransferase
MDVVKNAWEIQSEEQALLALAGHNTPEEFERDRRYHAGEIARLCAVTKGSRGFEIGSGEGTVASILAEQCLFLDCNDISASFLEKARANCARHTNVAFHKIESDYLDYLPAASYDFGYALHVFIHFNPYDIFNYLTSVQRLLKPGGRFFFDAYTIGEQTIASFREHAEMYRKAPEYIRGYLNFNHPNVLRTVIREAGLQVSDRSELSESGWMRVLVIKQSNSRSDSQSKGFWPFRR